MKTIALTPEQHDLLAEMVADAIRASLPPRFNHATGSALIGGAEEYGEAAFLAMRRTAVAEYDPEFDPEDAEDDAQGEAAMVAELVGVYRALLKGGA